jgi:CheY-like chemotaxis protein
MPKMDGFTATRLIREQERLADLPIIAVTADAAPSQEEECLAAGMNDCVSKPLDPNQLYSVMQKWVTGSGHAALIESAGMVAMLGADIRLPGRIEGVDLRAGLRRVLGMKALYVKLLGGFVEQQSDVVDRLRRSIAEGDMDRAIREVHTFKGLAYMIEAIELGDLALGIETALAAADIKEGLGLVDRLETRLLPLLGAIRAAIDEDTATA